VTVDVAGSECPRTLTADITRRLPFADDSAVVFVSCVLEYVSDLAPAVTELARVSGGHLYVVRVEPWTLTAYAYPGARRTITASDLPATAVLG
jgi:SAM-dependent methyltransferase